jgi:hypothetical protein
MERRNHIRGFVMLGITACSPLEDLGNAMTCWSKNTQQTCYAYLRSPIDPIVRCTRIETTRATLSDVYL